MSIVLSVSFTSVIAAQIPKLRDFTDLECNGGIQIRAVGPSAALRNSGFDSCPFVQFLSCGYGMFDGMWKIFRVRVTNTVRGAAGGDLTEMTVFPAWYGIWYAYVVYMLAGGLVVCLTVICLKRMAERWRRIKAEKEWRMRQLHLRIGEEQREKEMIKQRNDHLEAELKHKSGELAGNVINLVRKNDMLQSVVSEMEELSESVKNDAAKAVITKKISDIRRNIRIHMAEDSNWDKFEENFNLVYDDFTRKLMTHHTGLKKTDIKLCAYLRMGLSSKEMASLLNTSVRSIETARYRLRKKLNVESGENLIDFIKSIDKKAESVQQAASSHLRE